MLRAGLRPTSMGSTTVAIRRIHKLPGPLWVLLMSATPSRDSPVRATTRTVTWPHVFHPLGCNETFVGMKATAATAGAWRFARCLLGMRIGSSSYGRWSLDRATTGHAGPAIWGRTRCQYAQKCCVSRDCIPHPARDADRSSF